MIFLWNIIAIIILLYTLGNILLFRMSYRFLFKKRDTTRITGSVNKFYIIVPLLREQERIHSLFENLSILIKDNSNIQAVFVTTERENLEKIAKRHEYTTFQLIEKLIKNSTLSRRISHYHYPYYNKVVAEQLNYAVDSITHEIGYRSINSYFCFYNADSKISVNVFNTINTSSNKVFQQCSLFTSNFKAVKKINYFIACFGIYQSIWTLKHEIPRLLISSNQAKLLSRLFKKTTLNYCVTHGLIISSEIFNQIGGFPVTKQGGEDIAIGYILRSKNIIIEPLPALENSDSPTSIKGLWVQLANWYAAILGYWDFYKLLDKNDSQYNAKKHIVLTIQGLYDTISWLLKGWFILIFVILGLIIGKMTLTIAILLINFYLSTIALFIINSRLDQRIFYQFSNFDVVMILILYPLSVVSRSFPAISGLFWFIKTRLGFNFIKLKTE